MLMETWSQTLILDIEGSFVRPIIPIIEELLSWYMQYMLIGSCGKKSNIQHIRTALIMWTWGCDLFSIRRQYAFGKKLDSSSKEKWWTRDFASMLVFKGKCQIVCVMAIHLVVKAKFLFSHRLCMKDDEILNFLVTIFKD